MKKEEIHLWDIKRILFGQAPPEFLLEVLIRSLILYLAAIVVMRWMGKRMNGQLTIIEFSVMVTMGAILASPMQVPDRGILQGLTILLCTLLFLRGINWLAVKRAGFEKLLQGDVSLLVKDGIIQLNTLQKTKITHQQLFEVLRTKDIFHLGKVKRLYIEASGLFSVYTTTDDKAGLPIYPPTDSAILKSHDPSADKACCKCGWVGKPPAQMTCPVCASKEWTDSIK
ncbi:MAG: hypothetical protein JWP69_984 [Flaviaesturariibacter sp.]|nr:hypothetical protein [Flaviaesturariibacter sp.]